MILYVAGPMSGIPQFNYPAFMSAADALREKGYDVRNPAEMDDPATQKAALASTDGHFGSGVVNGETWGDFLARDVKLVADEIDGVCLLPGWVESRGARLEAFVALSVQKPVFLYANGDAHKMGDEYIMKQIAEKVIDQGDVSRYGGK